MAETIHLDDDLSLDIAALQDLFKPIATALDLGLPPYPPASLDYEVSHEGGGRLVRLMPSTRLLEWRESVVVIIEAQKHVPPPAPSDYKPA